MFWRSSRGATLKNILIVPGWKANELAGWMPWLLKLLSQRQILHRFCPMPHQPVPITWTAIRRLRRIAKEVVGPRVIMCHSFGGKVALKALSSSDLAVDALIMVAPLYRWPLSVKFCFWANYIDFARLKANCPKIIIFHSTDDRLVPFQNGAELARLCAVHGIEIEMHTMSGRGHFDPASNCFELPELMEAYDRICAST